MTTILFIDDDELRTRALREGLERLGEYEVVHIQTPQGAKETFLETPERYALIVLDIMLPHYDIPEYRDFEIPGVIPDNRDSMFTGLKVMLQLDSIMKERNFKIPIMLLTNMDSGTLVLCLKGMQVKPERILYKPLHVMEFMKEINSMVSMYRRPI